MLNNLFQRVANWLTVNNPDPSKALQHMQPTVIQPTVAVPAALSVPPARPLRTVKLIMVTAENNNKIYEMREQADDTFTVQFGRVGAAKSTTTYPMAQWDKKFREKVAKGYVDQTHLYAEKALATDAATIANPDVRGLMSRLLEFANQSIYQNYVVTAQDVTRKQIDTAQQLLDELAALIGVGLDVTAYNSKLLDLFKVIPRKMGKVGQYLVAEPPAAPDDLQPLHNRLASEQDILDVMRGQVELAPTDADAPPLTLLESLNLTVEPVTDKRVLTLIERMMGRDADKFDAAFSVRQAATQTAFEQYVSGRVNRKTQLLWHGSRSENWLSILKTGLLLRPANAVITGKMFGYGIYFADQFSKSLNYTSLHGSVWANGNQKEAYLGIYDVHVGRQMVVTQHEAKYQQLDGNGLKRLSPNYDSVYAQRGVSLLKNEFVVYHPAQCTVRYIVRIKV